jgi:hypothetical protein
MATMAVRPRSPYLRMLDVRNPDRPVRSTHGAMNSRLKRLRKNASSNGCRRSARWWMVPAINAKFTAETIMKAAPRIGPGVRAHVARRRAWEIIAAL